MVVPVLLSLSLSAVLLLPRIATTAWRSGQHLATQLPSQIGDADVLAALASLLQLLALALPVIGTMLMASKLVRMVVARARAWSDGRASRQVIVTLGAVAALASLAWAWWPAGQYHAVRPDEDWTLAGLAQQATSPRSPAPLLQGGSADAPPKLTPGRHLAIAMIPRGGATRKRPALFIIRGTDGQAPVAILDTAAPAATDSTAVTAASPSGSPAAVSVSPATTAPSTARTLANARQLAPTSTSTAVAFPFKLPSAPKHGETRALAMGKADGGTVYDIAYTLVTVKDGAPVNQTNSAYALASCRACTTIAVSFQVVLVVGQSKTIAPVNVAEALNNDCPACVTAAIADQIVVTLRDQPSAELVGQLTTALKKLDAISALGPGDTTGEVTDEVTAVQHEIDDALDSSGLLASATTTTPTTPPKTTSTAPALSTTPTETTTTPTPSSVGPADTTTTPSAGPADTTPSDASAGSTVAPDASSTSKTTTTPAVTPTTAAPTTTTTTPGA